MKYISKRLLINRVTYIQLINLILFCLLFYRPNLAAQNPDLLYGVTTSGGSDGGGVIFHIDRTNGQHTVDYSFPLIVSGANPKGELIAGNNGKYYGMTEFGGKYSRGVIFEWDPATNIFIDKYDFDLLEGSQPSSSLTLYNGKFYGMTTYGGSSSKGVIFEWDPITNTYTKKISFNAITGGRPLGRLVEYQGKFYGMTEQGGIVVGAIFEWDPATNIILLKKSFNTTMEGTNPSGSLTLYNGKFYGMTKNGGLYYNNGGVIFEWDPVTNIYIKKFDFDGAVHGKNPMGSLTLKDYKIYGLTSAGGLNDKGTVFEWDPATGTLTKKIDLSTYSVASPYGDLTYYNGKFYGMTYSGVSIKGSIFEWDPTTNVFASKHNFFAGDNGSLPYGSLTLHNGKFLGMTSAGGKILESGVLFEWDPVSNIYSKKLDFYDSEFGSSPYGSLTLVNNKYYGVTSSGGTNGAGTIIEWNPVQNSFSKKVEIDGTANYQNSSNPYGTLAYLNGKFYGTSKLGGAGSSGFTGLGTLFEWNPVTNVLVKKIDFDVQAKGYYPQGTLTYNDGKFLGTTMSGGANNFGVIFEWDPITNVFTVKYNFTVYDGKYPADGLIKINGKFYGMTNGGGNNSVGVIYEWDPVSNTCTRKFNFTAASTGSTPEGSLTFFNGKLYGLTSFGGINNGGVLFEWDPFTNVFTKKIDFDGILKGYRPGGTLILHNNKFYGMTSWGGLTSNGVVFEWDPVSNVFVKLSDFNNVNGQWPAYTQLVVYNDSATLAQASNVFAFNQQINQMTINWTNGNGTKRSVFMKEDNSGTVAPVNNTTYIADTVFGNGTQVGLTAWYCIFNGNSHDSGVTVTNLLPNTTYRLMVCEYTGNPGLEQYNNHTSEGNPFSLNTTGYSCTITTSSNPASGGNTSGGGSYVLGTQATVTATPNTGWNFVTWTENGNPVSTNTSYTFTVTGARTLVANFVQQQFSITTVSNPVDGGSTTGGATYNYGVQATVTATPSIGYNFSNWTENGNIVSANTSYTFTVTGARNLVAGFVIQQFNITTASNPVAGGTITGGGTYNYGAQAIVTAISNSGYSFSNWTENGNIVATNTSYTFTVTGARTLVANFILQQYSITTASNPPAGGTSTGGGTYNYGVLATVTATSYTNWTFLTWTENGNTVSTALIYSFTVTANRTLIANYTQLPTFEITTTSYPVTGGTTSGGGNYYSGQSATVLAIANAGYDFINWTENGIVVSADASYSFTVTGNRALVANYTQLPTFEITTTSYPVTGGTTSGGGNYYSGQSATVTATNNTGYDFINWTDNGIVVSTDTSYSFTVTDNKTLIANFLIHQFLITTSSNPVAGGTTTGGGIYNYGIQATLSAIPSTDWSFLNWTENGIVVSLNSAYTIIVTEDRNLSANFLQSAEVERFDAKAIRIFPNPTRDKLYLEWNNTTTQKFDEIYMFNTLSEVVLRQKIEENTESMSVNVKGLNPGLYVIALRQKDLQVAGFRIIIQP